MTISPAGALADVIGGDGGEGGGSQGGFDVPWQVVAWAAVGIVVLVVLAVIVLLILGRRPGRLPWWRQKRLEVEETMLGEGPRRALIRLRLQLDEAIAVAKSAVATEAADIGDLRLLVTQLESAAGRVSAQIDALLDRGGVNVPRSVVDVVRARVREIEEAAASLSEAATAAVMGATAVQIEDLSRGVRDQLQFVEARTDALREMSAGIDPPPRRPTVRKIEETDG